MSKGRDYQYEVRVEGQKFMTGDAHSTGVLFGNLQGRNFDKKDAPQAEHQYWLNYMAKEYETTLPLGAAIALYSPEGSVLQQGTIGKGLPTAA